MSVKEIFETMAYGPAPESPEAALEWLDEHNRKFDLFIRNKWVAPEAGKYHTAKNPATGETLAEFAVAGEAEINAAAKAARDAFKTWSKTSGHTRARYLYAIARGIQKHARLLAVVEALDNGKPIRETRDLDIPLVARHFYHHAGWAQIMERELPDFEPVGVVGQIIPWNFPLLMLAWKIAPALAMGNTVVLKPAPYTSLTALLFAEITVEAGLPPGVVNIVTGDDDTGALITNNRAFDKIAFTGSTNVGRIIRRVTAGTGTKLSLELGGKSPFIVFEDADQDSTIEGLVDAIWFNQGQVCCAGSKLLVQESIAERFLEKLRARMSKLRVGDSLDKGIDIGAIVDPVQQATIERLVKVGLDEGAEIYQPETPTPENGCYYPPTLLTNVQPASTVAQEEIFGPVLVAMTFRTPAEAVELANNTRYGLAASIWSENINLALDIARKVKAGSVWVNCTNIFDAAAGFGGYRESGFGREGGEEGLYEYVQLRGLKHPRPELRIDDNGAWGKAIPGRVMALNGAAPAANGGIPTLDRTTKMYIGGKQKRPDGNYSRPVTGPKGNFVAAVSDGNRKDIRDAVSAARSAADGWAARSPHNRAQILYYIAENLAIRADEFADRIRAMTGASSKAAQEEVAGAIERWFTWAARADKHGGTIQETELRGVTMALREPVGVIGIAAPETPALLGFSSLLAPAIARGNTVVLVPSQTQPLSATDFYQILETSDVPAGVVNIVTGDRDHLTKTLAEHDDVDAMWYFGTAEGGYHVEYASANNMKRTWVNYGEAFDWENPPMSMDALMLYEATQIKNVWVPTGE